MTYSHIDFKYLEARADRESLREFIGKEAGPDPASQLDLIRNLAPSILIADGYDFNELRELYAPMGLCCEHVSSAWSGDYRDDSLRCIAVRPFKPGGYDSHPYEFVQRLAGHLRDLLVRAETTPDFGNIIRHAYIEPECMDRWKEAAERWRLTQGTTQEVDEAQKPDISAEEKDPPKTATSLPGLSTRDIAYCFAGLRWETEEQWKKPLGDQPKWLAVCITMRGQRGVIETHWDPVLLGAALARDKGIKVKTVRARFQTNHLLKPYLSAWNEYEDEYFSEE